MNYKTAASVHFKDKTPVKQIIDADYLGANITQNCSRTAELQKRLATALDTARKLNTFWKKTNAP